MPRFQNRGLGKAQAFETLRRLKKLSFRKATVTTSEHPFFLPARRVYLSCGFTEVRRYVAGPDASYRVMLLEQEMTTGNQGLFPTGDSLEGLI